MRLFVAVVPPEPALAHLDDAVAAVRREHPSLRWVAAPRWHLTLAFLGQVEERRLPDLTARLERAAGRHPALDVALSGAGRFDGRVLWVGVTGDAERLVPLAASVNAAVRRTGIEVEERRYRPHVTLARAREPMDLRPVVAALSSYVGPPWRADELRLVRSTLGRTPRYDDVGSWPLAGG